MNRSTEQIPFFRPSLGEEEEHAVLRVMRSGWLTTGAEAQAFENEFADWVGVRHAVAVNSATAGLHLALEAVGVGPGDRVIMSPYTFTATAEVVRYLGADPLFCDIEEESCNIDPDALERLCEQEAASSDGAGQGGSSHGAGENGPAPGPGPGEREGGERRRAGRLAAVVPVHIGGMPCAMERLLAVARRFGLAVVEDAAHSFPGRTALGYMGTLGDVGVYSFYATKTITTGEGGMLVTENEALADRARLMRLHGIDRDVWNRYRTVGARAEYDVVEAGYKYNLPDILAAIGRVQLLRAQGFLERRREIAARYRDALGDCPYLRVPHDAAGHSWHLFLLGLELDRLEIDRDGFMAELAERGVGTSLHYKPLHLLSYYREGYALKPADFPVSLARYQSTVSLPIYPSLRDEEVDRVISAVREVGDMHVRGGRS